MYVRRWLGSVKGEPDEAGDISGIVSRLCSAHRACAALYYLHGAIIRTCRVSKGPKLCGPSPGSPLCRFTPSVLDLLPCADLTGEFNSPIVRMSYTSLTTPPTVIDLHVGTGKDGWCVHCREVRYVMNRCERSVV